ncbi:TetR family transcriptional regulator C-terminal domain-containing protein, partial [Kitasatospora sp. NPDC093558]|uniref:LmrA/YxaF family transcription factor n=1 Tax=Kitasatospora sp. NPDC093558 TaxID=3155201 RepID=UPI0034277174
PGAVVLAGRLFVVLLWSLAAAGGDAAALTSRLTEVFADRLERSGYTKGCPIATVALEVAGTNEPLRAVCSTVYESWQRVIAERLEAGSFSPAEAWTAAGQALALMEGAVLLASVRRSREPLDHARHAVLHLIGAKG